MPDDNNNGRGSIARPPSSEQEWLARVDEQAAALAGTLAAASDAGVSHALILPRLMLAFRGAFGEPPPGFVLPAVPGTVDR